MADKMAGDACVIDERDISDNTMSDDTVALNLFRKSGEKILLYVSRGQAERIKTDKSYAEEVYKCVSGCVTSQVSSVIKSACPAGIKVSAPMGATQVSSINKIFCPPGVKTGVSIGTSQVSRVNKIVCPGERAGTSVGTSQTSKCHSGMKAGSSVGTCQVSSVNKIMGPSGVKAGSSVGTCQVSDVNKIMGPACVKAGTSVGTSQVSRVNNMVCPPGVEVNPVYEPLDESDSDEKLFVWTEKAIRKLINERLERDDEFQRPTCKKIKLWKKIAEAVSTVTKQKVTGETCSHKWRNLSFRYNDIRKKLKSSGEGSGHIKWQYYAAMHEILGNRSSISPPREHLASSLMAVDENEVNENNLNVSNQRKRKRSEKNKDMPPLWLGDIFEKIKDDKQEAKLERNKRAVEENKRWKEYKDMEEKRIEAIIRLTKVLEETKRNNED